MKLGYLIALASACFAATLLPITEAQQTCNATILDECLKSYSNVTQDLVNFAVNSTDFDSRCKAYNDAVNCVGQTTGCNATSRDVLIKWAGLKQALGYVCKDAKSDYIRHAPCLSNDTFTSALKANCSTSVGQYKNPVEVNSTPETACREYTEALRCRQAVAVQSCGTEAGEFYRKFSTNFLEPPVKYLAPTCTGKCSSKDLEACIKDFLPYGNQVGSASLNETELTETCRQRGIAAECIKKTQCTDEDTITQAKWLGPGRAAEYVCGEGKAAFLKNRECLSNDTYLASRNKCNSPTSTSTSTSTLQQACQALVSQLTCMNNVTEIRCGKDAAGFISKLAPKLLAPSVLAVGPSCTLPAFSNAVTLLYSTLLLMTSLILTAVV